MKVFSLALGVGTQNKDGCWLEVFYPDPLLHPSDKILVELKRLLNYDGGNHFFTLDALLLKKLSKAFSSMREDRLSSVCESLVCSKKPPLITILENDTEPKTIQEGYLKLHLLSYRLVKPNNINLNGLFGILPNVAWTNEGAIDIKELANRQLEARLNNLTLSVNSIDKFPKMVDYVVPSGVRIADTARVRLGAYIGEGTTIMHEGFVNFNAGTECTSMIEGRVSQGVFIKKGSDLGGGSSTMGTLSGGGEIIITIGRKCLLGANSGLGIPLGDCCTIEAGLYITAGTKVKLIDNNGELIAHTKARNLANKDNLLFRRNSKTGAVECLTNNSAVELNDTLHDGN
ncbi:MAG: 2,3,4,5-tetrahydropyridine-2,6-dicarboxylate N-succinyltransferase [Porticoccus sp.]|jgi:2,3,4,5-tetrahydropyridine-2-carboxylate N-succinyltransferase|nr:2,3,4,5-tetrahydropyridine-2,6-dicarboxylate N-succinyltransferase [Porticoccus sp.]